MCPDFNKETEAAKDAAAAAAPEVVKKTLVEAGQTSDPVIAAMLAVIKVALGVVWESAFCTVECDECAGPAGILGFYQGCNLSEIQAIGTFEHANRWYFLIDANFDNSYEQTITRDLQNSVRISDLPNGNFKVIADAECDDENRYEWSGPRNQPVTVYANLNDAFPVGWITSPTPINGFAYRPNTQLCFTLNENGTSGLHRSGWVANRGSPSSSSGNSSTFCTTFNSEGPAWVGARYINPCNTSQEKFISTSFIICSSC